MLINVISEMISRLFSRGASFHPDTDIPSLDGKIVLITGGASYHSYYRTKFLKVADTASKLQAMSDLANRRSCNW